MTLFIQIPCVSFALQAIFILPLILHRTKLLRTRLARADLSELCLPKQDLFYVYLVLAISLTQVLFLIPP